jgi:UDP-N-acetylglucosamine 2-epimerase (non-hydrolysing)
MGPSSLRKGDNGALAPSQMTTISGKKLKILVVAGARPNFMKVAPLLAAFKARDEVDPLLVHTGQHYDAKMSDNFFHDLGLPEPDMYLDAGSGSHAEQTARVLVSFEKACLQWSPDLVVVVGDVNSTMACAISAKKLGIKVAHVEAGLRSRDMAMPEEINRLCTDVISDYLFTTEPSANRNLAAEGFAPERIFFVGNTMIDTLKKNLGRALDLPLPAGVEGGKYAVLTLHRPSNVDTVEALSRIFSAVNSIAERIPIVFPAHPRTAGKLSAIDVHPNVHVTEPLGYLAFLGLMARSRMVLTDSGGIQEETTVLGVPCLTMRENTERPITCEVGTNLLVGTDPEHILRKALAVLDGPPAKREIPEKWDGKAGERIVDVLIAQLSADRDRTA